MRDPIRFIALFVGPDALDLVVQQVLGVQLQKQDVLEGNAPTFSLSSSAACSSCCTRQQACLIVSVWLSGYNRCRGRPWRDAGRFIWGKETTCRKRWMKRAGERGEWGDRYRRSRKTRGFSVPERDKNLSEIIDFLATFTKSTKCNPEYSDTFRSHINSKRSPDVCRWISVWIQLFCEGIWDSEQTALSQTISQSYDWLPKLSLNQKSSWEARGKALGGKLLWKKSHKKPCL